MKIVERQMYKYCVTQPLVFFRYSSLEHMQQAQKKALLDALKSKKIPVVFNGPTKAMDKDQHRTEGIINSHVTKQNCVTFFSQAHFKPRSQTFHQ